MDVADPELAGQCGQRGEPRALRVTASELRTGCTTREGMRGPLGPSAFERKASVGLLTGDLRVVLMLVGVDATRFPVLFPVQVGGGASRGSLAAIVVEEKHRTRLSIINWTNLRRFFFPPPSWHPRSMLVTLDLMKLPVALALLYSML